MTQDIIQQAISSRYRILLGFFVISILVACTPPPMIVSIATPTPVIVANKTSRGDFVVELWVSNLCPYGGDVVTVKGTVTNNSSQTRIIDLNDQIVFDLIIADSSGQSRWSDGKPLPPDLMRLELKPHESRTIEMKKMVQSGSVGFEATAQLIDDPRDARGPLKQSMRVYSPGCPGGY